MCYITIVLSILEHENKVKNYINIINHTPWCKLQFNLV